ncbi:MAG: PEP/pyruvate-binding domain-containing protein, partial [Phycisphaerae bacterium]
ADLGLTNPPSVTRVSTGAEALEMIKSGDFDLVITMLRLGDMDVASFSQAARRHHANIQIVLLISGDWDLTRVTEMRAELLCVDDIYVWHGDTKIFLAMIKLIEDRWNADYDTRVGDVGVIIVVEDSIRFLSSLLPIMYTHLVSQTRAVMRDGINRMHKLMRMRARTKILTAHTFEAGMELFERYQPYVVGVICDVEFPRAKALDPHAGIKFIREIKRKNPDTAALLQSSDAENRQLARDVGANFLHKRSNTLLADVGQFMLENFGFGDFVFRLPDQREVGRANDLRSMAKALSEVPVESLEYHATRNHFSNWLRARTEFALSRRIKPRRVSEFRDLESLRKYLVKAVNEALSQSRRGVVEDFSRERFDSGSRFVRIGGGSLGGKARGVAFFEAQLADMTLEEDFEGVRIHVPRTVVIGTEVFDQFLEQNHLRLLALRTDNDDWIRWAFLTAKLPEKVRDDLRAYLEIIKTPIAVRSSSLLEDSQHHPFAGVYATHMIPNNAAHVDERLEQLADAIKLVYASTYFHNARQCLNRTPHRIEEEKMAVILQPVVGAKREHYFYPDFAGVALSYNFYPFGHMKPDDGVAYVALGLGAEVVEGGKSLRFSPAHPQVIPELGDGQEFLSQSQRTFRAVCLQPKKREANGEIDCIVELELADAERHGTLAAVGSTWSPEDRALHDGIYRKGVRAVTFAHVLKADVFPLAPILQRLLEIGRKGMNAAVEIEFAVNLQAKPPEFAVLQVRPCVTDTSSEQIELGHLKADEILCFSTSALGNGVWRDIYDIVYVDPETFDTGKTVEIADEIGQLNQQLLSENRQYMLIGPGRWGSSNKWLGIPVKWGQISAARVLVETTLEQFRPELSQGSHFFHNLTSFGIAYLAVQHGMKEDVMRWDWLASNPVANSTAHVRHLRLDSPIEVRVDGRTSRAAATFNAAKPGSPGAHSDRTMTTA